MIRFLISWAILSSTCICLAVIFDLFALKSCRQIDITASIIRFNGSLPYRVSSLDPRMREGCQGSLRHGLSAKFRLGLQAGVHTGWVTIEAEDEKQAMLVVPPFLRNKARAIKLVKLSSDLLKEMHPE